MWWNDRSLLFVKDVPKYKDIIEKYEFRYFTPYNLFFNKQVLEKAFNNDKDKVTAEFLRKLSDEPKGIVTSIGMKDYGNKLK